MANFYSEHINYDDDFSAALYQRTEELDQIPNALPDSAGRIHLKAIVLDRTTILPNMVSPLFIHPGSELQTIKQAQEKNSTVIGIIPHENGGFLDICLELVVGRLLELPDGNYSALVQGRRRLRIQQINKSEN